MQDIQDDAHEEGSYSEFMPVFQEDVQSSFKERYSYEERFAEFQCVRCNYPGFIPVCCEIEPFTSTDKSVISRIKLYVSQEILVGHLRHFLKNLLLQKYSKFVGKKDVVIIVVGEDVIVKLDVALKEVYMKKQDNDGWLYLKLSIDH